MFVLLQLFVFKSTLNLFTWFSSRNSFLRISFLAFWITDSYQKLTLEIVEGLNGMMTSLANLGCFFIKALYAHLRSPFMKSWLTYPYWYCIPTKTHVGSMLRTSIQMSILYLSFFSNFSGQFLIDCSNHRTSSCRWYAFISNVSI